MDWKIREKAPKEFLLKFPELHPAIANLLYSRKIIDPKKVEQFLDPDYCQDLHDPFLMSGVKKSVERIKKAISEKQKIIIFGDYDADGVCASAVVSQTLKLLDADVSVYIPNRESEGNGMNLKAIQEFIDQKVSLIITVDCGISNSEEVELSQKNNIDVIITDHHPVTQKVPEAFAIIDPKQDNDDYPFKDLAGVGVAYKLMVALFVEIFSVETRHGASLQKKYCNAFEKFGGPDGYLKWLLDIVALGTVADVCPLVDENRTLVKFGLIVLEKNRRLGLQELLKTARLHDGEPKISLNTYNLGFHLGPRLNASGRIDHANTSYQLLVTESQIEACSLAEGIEEKNTRRQQLTKQTINRIKQETDLSKETFVFSSSSNNKAGIAGLIAGKIAGEFSRPAFIISEKDEISKGSCRAPDYFAGTEFHLGKMLAECKDVLLDFGGHAQAAGFSIKKENIPKFKEKLKVIFAKKWDKKISEFKPCLEIDAWLESKDINWDLLGQLQQFEPFGEGNRQPLFTLENVFVKESRIVGNGSKHLKLTLCLTDKDGKIRYIDGIGFGLGEAGVKADDNIDVAFYLEENFWNGSKSIQLNIKDIKTCPASS